MENQFVLKWGILGCGSISKRFTQDLLIETPSRGVTDISHHVVAIGSSSTLDKAKDFAKQVGLEGKANCYGSYKELLADPTVTAIYIGTPHSCHHENVLDSLKAGKHVLCEKPFTISRAEAEECFNLAKEKNLFLMEAMWSRFFPLTKKLQEFIAQEKIGKVVQVLADLGVDFNVDNIPLTDRILDPNLGGGALLDLGVYPITWSYIVLYALNGHESPQIASSMLLNTRTKVDRISVAILTFKKAEAVAYISCNIDKDSGNTVEILGRKGKIKVRAPLYRPSIMDITVDGEEPQTIEFKVPGHGFYYQADEVARSVRDGKLECPIMSWNESLEVLRTTDEIRKNGGLVYPQEKK